MIPFAILHHGTMFLDAYFPFSKNTWWIQRDRLGHWSSVFPIVLPVLLTPLYIPAAIYVRQARPSPWRFETLCGLLEKFFASVIAALSVVVLLIVLRRLTSEENALMLAIAFAFGTETWAISSQALWQHGLAELLLALGLLFLTLDGSPSQAIAMGVVCGLLAFNRPPDVFFSLALAVGYLVRRRPLAIWFLVAAVAVGAPFLIYNLLTFHHPAGGYGMLVQGALVGSPLRQRATSAVSGFAALLVSPGKGLVVYSPFFLFIVGAPMIRFSGSDRLPAVLLWAAFFLVVVVHSFTDWRAGSSYGPRFLTDALPFLVVALVPALERLSMHEGKPIFFAAVLFAIAAQVVGVFCFPGGGSVNLSQSDLWKPSGAQFYREAKAGFQREDYYYTLRHWLGVSGHP
ncbi:MAG TPA: hypothetical protein VJA66_09720 [Thermoanaerobaculia bacterium]